MGTIKLSSFRDKLFNFILFILMVMLLLSTVYSLYYIHINKLGKSIDNQTKLDLPEQALQSNVLPPITLEKEILPEDNLVIELSYSDKTILAKLLYREAGSMSWEGQVWVCSAIINLGKARGLTIDYMAHKPNMFSVAPIVDSAKPKQMQYEVIDYIQHHGTIPEVKYFRTNHFHRFGTPVRRIGNVYFSK